MRDPAKNSRGPVHADHDTRTNTKPSRRIAVAATGLSTAFLVALAIVGGNLDPIETMAPFWLLTLLVGAATYAAGGYLASRTDTTHTTIDLTADDRVTTTV